MWLHFKTERERKARIQARLSGSKSNGHESSYALPLVFAGLMWLAVVFLLRLADDLTHAPLTEGQRASSTVIAQVDFDSADLAATELARRQAADAVLPVFTINQNALQYALRVADQLIDRILELRAMQADSVTAILPEALDVSGTALPLEEAYSLVPLGQEEALRGALRSALTSVWSQGIISASEKESLFHGVASAGSISIGQPDQSLRSPVEIAQLYSPDEAARATTTRIQQQLAGVELPTRALRGFVRLLIQPNIIYDSARTEAARQLAQRNARPVSKSVRAGSTLINQGDRVSPQQLEDWRTHERRVSELQTPQDRRFRWIGRSVLLLFALVICSGLLQIVRPDIVQSPSRILLLVLLALITMAFVSGLLYLSNSDRFVSPALVEFILPLAFAPILVTILIGPATAVVVGAWTSFAAAVMFDNSFSIFAMGLLVTIIVAHMARKIRVRSRMLRIGFVVGLAQTVYVLSLAVVNQLPPQLIAVQAGFAVLNGMASAFLALLLLPLFESLFDITTDITLLELSDMGHPLLQRLAIEAPGTYHHSLMVAHLAQAAAAEVGGNDLLVRVCAYFHDIGKLTKPEFFVENTQFRENPHDDLTPSMSTLVIISHVKEGVTMARRAKLPKPIVDAIEQHHGTSLVAFFFHRAKTQQAGTEAVGGVAGRDLQDSDFRYPGPKPRTREMGILLLADSVEAASRSMEKPTPSRIEHLVHDIVNSRLQDEQLDDCDLTFAQLKAIKKSFIFTLTNMLHGRVPYPKDEHRNQQPAEKSAPASPPTEEVRPMGDGSSPSPR